MSAWDEFFCDCYCWLWREKKKQAARLEKKWKYKNILYTYYIEFREREREREIENKKEKIDDDYFASDLAPIISLVLKSCSSSSSSLDEFESLDVSEP